MKNLLEKTTTNAFGKLVSMITEKELMEWPPPCLGFYYQPEQPIFPIDILKTFNKNQEDKS